MAAHANWDRLFSYIAGHDSVNFVAVELTDSHADVYDFANELLMTDMRSQLLLELTLLSVRAIDIGLGPNDTHTSLSFGNKFFMTMNEQEQQRFFQTIFNLRIWRISVGEATDNSTESPAITISTPALLETLPQLHAYIRYVALSNFSLTCPSHVEALSNIIGSKRDTLRYLALKSVECPVDDCNKQDSDESDGFLDPLFSAASDLRTFSVSSRTLSVHSTLVSPRALRALFVEGKRFRRLTLSDLGLTDSHVLVIVDGLSTPGAHLSILDLESNPDITDQGYRALLKLVNGADVIGDDDISDWQGFIVDDKAWEGKLNLVSEMNSNYVRLEYLTNGTFTSAERRLRWLEKVASLPMPDVNSGGFSFRGTNEEWEAKHLNFIWYTLCENPEMMQT